MNGKFIFLYASILHLLWAIILVFYPPVRTTAIDFLLRMLWDSPAITSILLILSVILALTGLLIKDKALFSYILLTPQQFFVIVSAVGAIFHMAMGHFADGVIRPHEFIIADQAPAVLLATLHAVALLERYAWKQSLFPSRRVTHVK